MYILPIPLHKWTSGSLFVQREEGCVPWLRRLDCPEKQNETFENFERRHNTIRILKRVTYLRNACFMRLLLKLKLLLHTKKRLV